MLKARLSEWAHGVLRNRAHLSVEAMDAGQVRDVIHRAAPIPGRIFTFAVGEEAQRQRIRASLDGMSHAELRGAAGDRLPALLRGVLEWLDR